MLCGMLKSALLKGQLVICQIGLRQMADGVNNDFTAANLKQGAVSFRSPEAVEQLPDENRIRRRLGRQRKTLGIVSQGLLCSFEPIEPTNGLFG